MTKKSRRLGVDLVGGDKAFERRPYPPGMHGRGRPKESEYLLQLREKQKAAYSYGVLGEAVPPVLRGGLAALRQDR
jgi:small subunit ribosomal protein S4